MNLPITFFDYHLYSECINGKVQKMFQLTKTLIYHQIQILRIIYCYYK